MSSLMKLKPPCAKCGKNPRREGHSYCTPCNRAYARNASRNGSNLHKLADFYRPAEPERFPEGGDGRVNHDRTARWKGWRASR